MRNWFLKRAPDRESLLRNRWLAPVASRLAPEAIWQFNRRSIARGLALGLFAGLLLPVGQIVLAVLLAASVRANVLVASAATLVTNPLTFPPISFAAYRTGNFLLDLVGTAGPAGAPLAETASLWSTVGATSACTFLGLIAFALVGSLASFAIVNLAWRLSLVRRWRRRRTR